MSSILSEAVASRFYDEWKARFEDNWQKYIRPESRRVRRWSRRVENMCQACDTGRPIDAWDYVYENVEYRLSKKWKTPNETIRSGIGDCEDVTFLLASIFPAMGVDTHQIVLGEIIFPDGKSEFHTWNEYQGMVIDATGTPESTDMIQYIPEQKWEISLRPDKVDND